MEHTGLIPLRLGATSYVIPGDLPANARHLTGCVADMHLVLFDLPGGPSSLPTPAQIDELAAIGRQDGLSYTVHLPADLPAQRVGDPLHPVLRKARDLAHSTLLLDPHAFVFHLDGMAVRSPETPSADLHRWQEDALHTLELVQEWVGDGQRLTLENVEGYALDFYDGLMASSVLRCVPVGHLWLDGHDPLPYVDRWLDRTRVIHVHGMMERDHRSLSWLWADCWWDHHRRQPQALTLVLVRSNSRSWMPSPESSTQLRLPALTIVARQGNRMLAQPVEVEECVINGCASRHGFRARKGDSVAPSLNVRVIAGPAMRTPHQFVILRTIAEISLIIGSAAEGRVDLAPVAVGRTVESEILAVERTNHAIDIGMPNAWGLRPGKEAIERPLLCRC